MTAYKMCEMELAVMISVSAEGGFWETVQLPYPGDYILWGDEL